MEQFYDAEAEIHDEWLRKSTKGGFAKDILDEIKSYRNQGVIPSAQYLYEMEKKKQEEKMKNSPTYQNAYEKAEQMTMESMEPV